ncbi:MAG TPA: 4-hydroxybenzoate octaprenyltransferase [Xanthomonadaceae bacterium]|jgi:4-hydroxybenzoate polyprenyltransferase|nr:4-hydroxybenzoate octaprenyltransferase [Xanthomonadaceae bacterium]
MTSRKPKSSGQRVRLPPVPPRDAPPARGGAPSPIEPPPLSGLQPPVFASTPNREPPPVPARSPDPLATLHWSGRLGRYWLLIRGHRPIGTLLLLWPTWWALCLAADGFPSLRLGLIFTIGVWLTRSAGCVINDYADRWLDPQVERTKSRPLATGAVSPRAALILFAVLMLIAFGLVLLTNRLTVELSFIGALLAASYPYLKRYTYLPQVYLGLAFGWGIPMAFAAVQGTVPMLAWLLFIANVVWATAYDTWYAMVDRDDDLRAGAKSTAILFGEADLVAQSVLYALFMATLVFVGLRAKLAPAYYIGLAVAAGLIALEFRMARNRSREDCFRAFLHNNWVGATVFSAIVLGVAMR